MFSSLRSTYQPLRQSLPDDLEDHPDKSPSRLQGYRSLVLYSYCCNSRFSWRLGIFLLGFLACIPIIFLWKFRGGYLNEPMKALTAWKNGLPPLYEEWLAEERMLPQLDLAYSEEHQVKYFFPAGYMWGIGFNNYLEELVAHAVLAYMANRSFVFPDFWAGKDGKPYTDWQGKIIPSVIPLNALLAGPVAGGRFDADDIHPLGVTEEFFRKVCPERTIINNTEVTAMIGGASGTVTLEKWVEKLHSIEDRCIEVDGWTGHIFDFDFFGTSRFHSYWDIASKLPILQKWAWSPLVYSIIDDNIDLLTLPTTRLGPDALSPMRGLLALHVRRGDYEPHCEFMGSFNAEFYNAYNLPIVPDKYVPAHGAEQLPAFMRRCYPSVGQIVHRVAELMQAPEADGIDRVYVLTNGIREWVQELKAALKEMGFFKKVSTSRDFTLTNEQKYIAQAGDMAIAQRAQYFVGNGWSSMSGNIVLLRLAAGFSPQTCRAW